MAKRCSVEVMTRRFGNGMWKVEEALEYCPVRGRVLVLATLLFGVEEKESVLRVNEEVCCLLLEMHMWCNV